MDLSAFFSVAIWDYLFFIYFLLYCTPLAAGCFLLAKKVCSVNPYERFAFTLFLFLCAGGINFGLWGVLGLLSLQSVFTGNLLFALLLVLLAKKLPEKNSGEMIPDTAGAKNIPLSQRLLAGFLAFWAVSRLYPVISMPPFGTDSYMYHLYYPAEWIRSGSLSRITIIGLFPEYYPVFGELLYGFLLLPMAENASMASTLQWASLVMASACMVFAAEELGYKRAHGLFAGCCFFCTGIVMMNLLMAYTDVLNAAFCFAGFAFLLAGCRRNSLVLLLFSGLLMGCSTAIKPLGMLWSPVLTLIFSLLFAYIYKPSFRKILLMYLAAIFTALPFFLKNYLETGNPLYPQKISLWGMEIFPQGIKAAVYHPIGLKDLPEFLFDGGIFGFNRASILLYGFAGTSAMVILILSIVFPAQSKRFFPEEKGGKVLKTFIPVILLCTLLHIQIYPRIAEPRSLLLLLMFWSIFFLPVLAGTQFKIGKRGGVLCLAGVIFACILPFSSFTTNFLTWSCNWGAGLAGIMIFAFCTTEKKVRRASLVLLLLLALILPCQLAVRGAGKNDFYKMMFSAAEARSCQIVQEMYRKGEKSSIDYVGGVFAYAYMEDMKDNKVFYVPISEKESTFVHEFGSYEKMREEPVKYEIWKERLKKASVNILIVNINSPALIFNRKQELKWAQAHPENFTLLVQDQPEWEKSSFFMYKVHDL